MSATPTPTIKSSRFTADNESHRGVRVSLARSCVDLDGNGTSTGNAGGVAAQGVVAPSDSVTSSSSLAVTGSDDKDRRSAQPSRLKSSGRKVTSRLGTSGSSLVGSGMPGTADATCGMERPELAGAAPATGGNCQWSETRVLRRCLGRSGATPSCKQILSKSLCHTESSTMPNPHRQYQVLVV
jgi:hypothetical protein